MATYGHLNTTTSFTSRSSRKCCGFSARFIHYVLFIFNFIFLMSGILIILMTLLYGTKYIDFGETRLNTIRMIIGHTHMVNIIHYSMIVCGFAICIIAVVNAVISCFRTKKYISSHDSQHNDVPLTSTRIASSSKSHHHRERYGEELEGNTSIGICFFIFALLFLFTLQLIIGMIAFIAVTPNSEGRDEFVPSLYENLNIIETLDANREKFDDLQQYFKCCGLKSYDDYEIRNKSDSVPDSCCKTVADDCGKRKHPSNIYYDGCVEKVGPVLKEYVIILGSVAFGFSVIEIFGLLFSCCLYVQLASTKR